MSVNLPSVGSPFVVLSDLDGVVWLAHQPIPGSVEAIARLRAAGHRVLFVTNNSAALVQEQEAALARIGIPAEGDVLTSAQAAALLVQPGERALVCGGDGILQALAERGVECVSHQAVDGGALVDVVVVGMHRSFDYSVMARAAKAIRLGARLVGSNDDATYPTPDGPVPGGGSILAAIQTAAGVQPAVAGKPHRPMADLVRRVIGDDAATRAVMVGDRPSTDGLFALTLGSRYTHVWSGVTPPGTVIEPTPDLACDDLAAFAEAVVNRGIFR